MKRERSVWPLGGGLALAAALGTAGAVACSAVTEPAPAAQPFNACPEHSCDLYAQSAGVAATCACTAFQSATSTACNGTKACLINATPPSTVFLRVDVPSGSAHSPGTTFLILDPTAAATAAATSRLGNCANTTGNQKCLVLPNLTAIHGALVVDYPTTEAVGFNLGNGPMSTTTLPVTATVTRLLKLAGATTAVPAAVAGVSIEPPLVSQILSGSFEFGGNTGVGPYGAIGVGFSALADPGFYDITLLPVAPFDAYFPPTTLSSGVTSIPPFNQFVPTPLTLDPSSALTTNIRSVTALDGLVAYLRNAQGQRLSTRVPLHGQDSTSGIPLQLQASGLPLQPSGQPDISSDFFVIAPADELNPAGRATFTNTAISITTGGLGTEQTYPQLPAPVSVSGQVFATGTVPTAADVVLTSTGIDRVDQTAPDDTSLSYTTSFTTDDCGNYTVTLPPGTYSAQVTPHFGGQTCGQTSIVPPALTVTTLDVATTPSIQNGKSLALVDALPLTGACRVADGRALAAATVILAPSTSLAANPGTVPAPRTFDVATDTGGNFTVYVDPGVYDVTVQPAAGSNLPWVVTTRQTVAAPAFSLADQVIPAPIAASYTVYDPGGTVITNALVTAYDMPASAADAGTTSNPAAVQVAQGVTDLTGTVNLLFAGTPR